jgi:N-acetylmuramoyl-L-alanine amidase
MSDTTPAPKKPAAVKVPEPVKVPVDEPVVEAPKVKAKAEKEPAPLRSAVYLQMRRTLSDGDHGPTVRAVQERMKAKGFWDGPCDGRYGTRMTRAVRSLQSAKGVRVTGEMNPWTWEALNL